MIQLSHMRDVNRPPAGDSALVHERGVTLGFQSDDELTITGCQRAESKYQVGEVGI